MKLEEWERLVHTVQTNTALVPAWLTEMSMWDSSDEITMHVFGEWTPPTNPSHADWNIYPLVVMISFSNV